MQKSTNICIWVRLHNNENSHKLYKLNMKQNMLKWKRLWLSITRSLTHKHTHRENSNAVNGTWTYIYHCCVGKLRLLKLSWWEDLIIVFSSYIKRIVKLFKMINCSLFCMLLCNHFIFQKCFFLHMCYCVKIILSRWLV